MVTTLEYYKCVTKAKIMLQLVCNVHTCDYAMCSHLHHSLWDTFTTSFFIMIPIDTICIVINAPLLKYNVQLCYDYKTTTYNLIKINIH